MLVVARLAKSTYYYHVKHLDKIGKYLDIRKYIQEIYEQHKGRYGYRRITYALHEYGITLNSKTVLKLMRELGLKCTLRPKKYRSYYGSVGKVANNILDRNFKTDKPNQKWVTDVTMFQVNGKKIFLSPIMDLYNNEIIAYDISQTSNLEMIERMMKQVARRRSYATETILHSDQGYHYQSFLYQSILFQQKITQSMSRKGNCLDNAAIESFFGTVKSEFYYNQEFTSIKHFANELHNYISYYNNERISLRLDGKSPRQYLKFKNK